MTFLDRISLVFISTATAFGFIANFALLAAIKCRSPASLKSYSILLTTCALIDLVACASTLQTIERVIIFPDMTVNVYLGPCAIVSGFFCHLNHSIGLQTNSGSMLLIVIETCYRYYVIARHSPSPAKVRALCLTILLPTLIVTILTCIMNDPSDVVREAIRVHHPSYFLDEYTLEGHVDSGSYSLSKVLAVICVAPSIPMLLLVFIIRRKIVEKLEDHKGAMTDRTREMHRCLVKVITLRALLPIFFFCTMIGYVLMKKGIYHAIWLEYAIAWFHPFMPSHAPVITLANVRPYRDFIVGLGIARVEAKHGAVHPQIQAANAHKISTISTTSS